jgi:hypothetical protein
LFSAVLDAGKGRLTFNLDGIVCSYDFLPASWIALPPPHENKEVEMLCFVVTFRDPLQHALERSNNDIEQNIELAQATEGLKAQDGVME